MSVVSKATDKLLDLLASIRFRNARTIPFAIGKLQRSCPIIEIRPLEEFRKFPLRKKLRSIFFGIRLNEEELSKIAFRYAKDEIFGDDRDLGSMLFCLNMAKFKGDLDFSGLTDEDDKKALALAGHSNISHKQYNGKALSPPLNLFLEDYLGPIALMIIPMSSRILVVSTRYFLEINPFFSFSQIRLSKHPRSSALIAYIYELMLLQQKTALALLNLHALAFSIVNQKKDDPSIILLREEMDVIAKFDLILTYFKASIEKTMTLVAEVHELPSIDGKGKHSRKVKALEDGLPESAKKQPYCQHLLNVIRSENLEELNNLRTGLLHKKGVSKLQPHAFAGTKEIHETPIPELMSFAMDHHRKAATILAGALALVVDELMRRSEKAKGDLKFDLAELDILFKDMSTAYETFWPQ